MSVRAAGTPTSEKPRLQAWRSGVSTAALLAGGMLAVTLIWWSQAPSPLLALTLVVALSTTLAMHYRLAFGRGIAAVHVTLCAAALATIGAEPRHVGLVLVTGLAAAELVAGAARRAGVVQAAAISALVAGVASLSGVMATVPRPWAQIFREAFAAAAAAGASAPLLLTIGPLAEWLFGHITPLTMNEWLDYQHPLLRRLATSAPGTFQHVVNVGVLSDAAATAIGGNALLARVGGLYHDVGKLHAPDYFIENQRGSNPHDQLPPWESARVLRAHVSDGVRLVLESRMGERVADFVREHHGASTMRSFAEKARTLGQAPDHHEDYRYPGPWPRSRETAIVMIADQLEASARSRLPADADTCRTLVRDTIERLRNEGALDHAGFRPRDLDRVELALARSLQAMYHHRPTYPSPSGLVPPQTRLPLVRRLRRARS